MNFTLVTLIASNLITGVAFFFVGYFVAKKVSQVDVFKYAVGLGVIGVWIFRLLRSSFEPLINVDTWEHIITGIVVFSLWGAGAKNGESFVDLVTHKITGISNGKK